MELIDREEVLKIVEHEDLWLFSVGRLDSDTQIALDTIKHRIKNFPTVQAVPIPENATNGDVIKAMFPNIIRTGIILSDKRENIIATNINLNWWDLPYKGSDAE